MGRNIRDRLLRGWCSCVVLASLGFAIQLIPATAESLAETEPPNFERLLFEVRDLERKDHRRAMELAIEAAATAARVSAPLWEARFQNEVAWNASHVRSLDTGLDAVKQALAIAEADGFLLELGDSHNFKGLLHYESGDYKLAEVHFLSAIRIRNTLADTAGVASCLNNIARIHMVQRQYRLALDNLNEGLQHIHGLSDNRSKQIRISLLNNKGLVSSFMGPDTHWEEAFEAAWNLALEMDSRSLQLEVLTFAVDACIRYEKVETLAEYLQLARTLTEGDLEYRWWNNFASPKARLLFLQGQSDAALDLLLKALENHTQTGRSDAYLQGIHQTLVEVYESKGQYVEALKHAKQLAEIGSEIHNRAIQDQLYRFKVQYESQEKQREIENLTEAVELRELQLQNHHLKQRQILLGSVVLILWVLILTVVVVVLHRSRNRIRVLNENLETYQRIAAHDLKNPLANISAVTDLLLAESREASAKNPEQLELYHLLKASVRQGLELIENLLEFHRIREGKLLVHPESISIDPFFRELKSQQFQLLSSKAQTLHIECDAVDELYHDRFALNRILSNLLTNAMKFSPHGSRIILRARPHETRSRACYLEVIDEGPGIPEQEQSMLFKRFSKLSPIPTGGESGTGLGLSISKELSSALGGLLSYHPMPQRGSCFRVTLPLRFGG